MDKVKKVVVIPAELEEEFKQFLKSRNQPKEVTKIKVTNQKSKQPKVKVAPQFGVSWTTL